MMQPMRPSYKESACVFNAIRNFRQKRGNGLLSTAGLLNGIFGSVTVSMWPHGRRKRGSLKRKIQKTKRSSFASASSLSMSWLWRSRMGKRR